MRARSVFVVFCFLFYVSIRLLVARLVRDEIFRIDGEQRIGTAHTLPTVARAFPVSTPPIAALQVDVERRVD